MKIIIPNVEVRGTEVKTSNKDGSQYIVINYDTEAGNRESIVDRCLDRQELYKRGTVGNIIADLKQGRTATGSYASLSVMDFIPEE